MNYDSIKNSRLKALVMASESIHSLPEAALAQMIARIAAMPEVGQVQLIAALEDEQKQIQAAKLAKGITPEVEMQNLKEGTSKLIQVERKFDGDVRKYREDKAQAQDEAQAENLIKSI